MKIFLIKSERFQTLHWQSTQLPLRRFKKLIKIVKLIHMNWAVYSQFSKEITLFTFTFGRRFYPKW